MRRWHVALCAVLVALVSNCAMLVPTDFKRSEAADGAVLTTLVQRYQLGTGSVDQAEAWQRLAEISANMELRNRWLRGEAVDWASTQAADSAKAAERDTSAGKEASK